MGGKFKSNIVVTYTSVHVMLQILKLAHTIIKEQGKKLAATYRCQSCNVIIQLVEIYSSTKRNAIHCPYCGKAVLEPRNIIFC
jgi:DNA-directed RNA polymerase subunit RPC12/RpoP